MDDIVLKQIFPQMQNCNLKTQATFRTGIFFLSHSQIADEQWKFHYHVSYKIYWKYTYDYQKNDTQDTFLKFPINKT